MKVLLVLSLLIIGSAAFADTLECKLVVNGKATRSYADSTGVATVRSDGMQCSGSREGMSHKVSVAAGGFVSTASGPGEQIVIIDGGSSNKEVYARSFCSCSSM